MFNFHLKGDLEKEQKKAISIYCDREKDKTEDMQIKLIDKVVEPSFKLLSVILSGYDLELRKNWLIWFFNFRILKFSLSINSILFFSRTKNLYDNQIWKLWEANIKKKKVELRKKCSLL